MVCLHILGKHTLVEMVLALMEFEPTQRQFHYKRTFLDYRKKQIQGCWFCLKIGTSYQQILFIGCDAGQRDVGPASSDLDLIQKPSPI